MFLLEHRLDFYQKVKTKIPYNSNQPKSSSRRLWFHLEIIRCKVQRGPANDH